MILGRRSSQLLGDLHEDMVNSTTILPSKMLKSLLGPTAIMQLLGHAGFRQIFASHRAGGSGITLQLDDGNEILDDGFGGLATRRRRRDKGLGKKFPPVPSEEGKKLMDGGVFGNNEYYRDITRKKNTKLARKLMSRELDTGKGQSTRAASAISQV